MILCLLTTCRAAVARMQSRLPGHLFGAVRLPDDHRPAVAASGWCGDRAAGPDVDEHLFIHACCDGRRLGDLLWRRTWSAAALAGLIRRIVPPRWKGHVFIAAAATAPEFIAALRRMLGRQAFGARVWGLAANPHHDIPLPGDRRWVPAA